MNILKQLWKVWRGFGRATGDLVGRAAMTLFYFTLTAPFGLGVRLFSDPLQLKPHAPRWEPRESKPSTLDEARNTF
jgi:hypothetical protein